MNLKKQMIRILRGIDLAISVLFIIVVIVFYAILAAVALAAFWVVMAGEATYRYGKEIHKAKIS